MRCACGRVAIIAALSVVPAFTADAPSSFSGRWDLTILAPNGSYPSWMEFADEGGTPAIRMVGRTGSVHTVRDAKVEGSHLTFADPQATGSGQWDLTVRDRKVAGRSPEGVVAGVPAPLLNRKPPAAWTV